MLQREQDDAGMDHELDMPPVLGIASHRAVLSHAIMPGLLCSALT
jgi:hypothetical protein